MKAPAARLVGGAGAKFRRRLAGTQGHGLRAAGGIGRWPKAAIERAKALDPQVLFVSATGGLGLEHLKRSLFA